MRGGVASTGEARPETLGAAGEAMAASPSSVDLRYCAKRRHSSGGTLETSACAEHAEATLADAGSPRRSLAQSTTTGASRAIAGAARRHRQTASPRAL